MEGLILVPGGDVHGDVDEPRRLGPHAVLGEAEVVGDLKWGRRGRSSVVLVREATRGIMVTDIKADVPPVMTSGQS